MTVALERAELLSSTTRTITVATGVLNLWMYSGVGVASDAIASGASTTVDYLC